jgi:AcrR family transcriptional regulator
VVGLREQHKQLTRKRLLESALEVFSAKGYANTSVDDLTTSAGASRATFYLHFSSKLDVLIMCSVIAVRDTPQLYAALDVALRDGSRAGIEAAIDDIIGWFESHSGLLQAWSEASMEDRTLPRTSSHLLEQFFEAMPYVRSKWPPAEHDQAKLRLQLFVLQLDRLFQTFAATGEWDFPRTMIVSVLADLWSHDFFPLPPAPRPAATPRSATPRSATPRSAAPRSAKRTGGNPGAARTRSARPSRSPRV